MKLKWTAQEPDPCPHVFPVPIDKEGVAANQDSQEGKVASKLNFERHRVQTNRWAFLQGRTGRAGRVGPADGAVSAGCVHLKYIGRKTLFAYRLCIINGKQWVSG